MNPLITVCIVHYRKLPQLKRTVADLLENTRTPIKIKILNQEYLDEAIKSYLSEIEKLENVEVIYGTKNVGCSPGRNILTRNIDTPFILSLDDDIYVNKDWDVPVMELFNKNPKVGAIGFSLYRINGT